MEGDSLAARAKAFCAKAKRVAVDSLWAIGTVALAVAYPLAMSVLEDRFLAGVANGD